MKNDYRKYRFDEFAQDESFRDWVIENKLENEVFWEQWIVDNPEQEKNIHLAKAFLLALQEKDTSLTESALEVITDEVVAANKVFHLRFWQNKIFKIAASILLFLGIGLSVFYFKNPTSLASINPTEMLTDGYLENTNSTKTIQEITLEDGSIISLYPKSKIRYPKPFSPKKREVYLIGKAFFNITKNPEKPFWVFTDHISTQVLGTSFMVTAFDDTKDASVQVKTGKVSVYTRKDLEGIKNTQEGVLAGVILTPNQQVMFSKNEARLIKSVVEKPEQIIEIKKEAFIFEETPISKVFSLLEKTYGITVIYDAKNMELCYLSANLEEETLYEKLDLICKITHSTYEIVDAQIIIHSKGCN